MERMNMQRRALQTMGAILALSVIVMVPRWRTAQDSAPAEKQFLLKLQLARTC
jgi:hypothetical protein